MDPAEAAPSADQNSRHLVAVCAVADGARGLEGFFKSMPANSGLTFLVSLLGADTTTIQRLARAARMGLQVVHGPTELRPDTVFVAGPGLELVTETSRVRPIAAGPTDGALLRSVASTWGERAIAVVLRGANAHGLADIRAGGGLALMEAPAESTSGGTGSNGELALPVSAMPTAILSFTGASQRPGPPPPPPPDDGDVSILAPLAASLRQAHQFDLGAYKPETVHRRIERRMGLRRVKSLAAYVDIALAEPSELKALYRDLLVGVTVFFRDPQAFSRLADRVLPAMFTEAPDGATVRAWCAGCATGEEPYSIAMLLLAAAAREGRGIGVKVFATDLNRAALAIAAEGRYPATALDGVPPELRDAWMEPTPDGGWSVSQGLRNAVLFSFHDITQHPPFRDIDLMVCRNLLVYLDASAQERALASMYVALRPRGTLFLGPSEALGALAPDFTTLHRDLRIHQKTTERRLLLRTPAISQPARVRGQEATLPPSTTAPYYEQLLARFVPFGILLGERREVLHTFGDAHLLLRTPSGRTTADILQLTSGHLKIALSQLLAEVDAGASVARVGRVPVGSAPVRFFDVTAEPLSTDGRASPGRIITFTPADLAPDPAPAPNYSVEAGAAERVAQLEADLQRLRGSLDAAVAELEAANQGLHATNDQLLSANEELQSTNEELKAVNEELFRVNAEREQKVAELHRVSDHLHNLIAASEVGSIFTDQQARIHLFTPAARAIFNLLPADVGRDLHHITSRIPDDDVFTCLEQVLAGGPPSESRVRTPEGRTFLRRIRPYAELDGTGGGVSLSFVDITDLAAAEAEVRALNTELEARVEARTRDLVLSNERMRLVADHATDGFWDWNLDTDDLYLSRSFGSIFGYAPGELPADRGVLRELVHPDDLERVTTLLDAHRDHGRPYQVSVRYRHKDGSWAWVLSRAAILRDADGTPRRMVGTHTDITTIKRAEEALRDLAHTLEARVAQRTSELAASEEQLRTVFEGAPAGVLVVDEAGTILLANPRLGEIFGYPAAALDGQPVETILPEEVRAAHRAHRAGFAAAPGTRAMGGGRTLYGVHRTGTLVPVEVGLSPVTLRGTSCVVAFVTDVTDRARAELALRQSEARFRATFENAAIGKAVQDPDGRILAVNRAFCALVGYSEAELRGRRLSDLTHPEDLEISSRLNQQLISGALPTIQIEKRFVRADRTVVWAALTKVGLPDAEGHIVETIAEVQELSALKEAARQQALLERKLLEAAKLESLGVLAGGVAHDFNNILSAITANAEILGRAVAGDPALADCAGDVVDASRRAAEICNQLLAYSGRGQFSLADTDLSWLVTDTERLIRLSLGKSVRLDLDLAQGLPAVHVDRAQIQQVIMNLVINGSEAIGDRLGCVSVRTTRISGARAVPPGSDWVALDVSDDGPGIPPETLGRIFDPFFTTKFKGRGLGLAAVQGIVAGHQGTLDVSSEVGRGTRFRMLLPAVRAAVAPSPEPQRTTTPAPPLSGTILVVDDEPGVRRVVRRVLERAGCVVQEAQDGGAAVALFALDPTVQIDLVLLDLTMPGMDGSHTLAQLRKLRPDIPVVLTSGYSESETMAEFVGRGTAGFLKKPFTTGELEDIVRRTLG